MLDLLVIGGGINGAGIARDAAGRGLKVLLVERGDLAGATSSASSRSVHAESSATSTHMARPSAKPAWFSAPGSPMMPAPTTPFAKVIAVRRSELRAT